LAPWPIAVVIGVLAWALAGWLVCAAFCLVGWLSDISQSLSDSLSLAASLFLLANGSRVVIAGISISIMPLLLTLAIMGTGYGLIRVALRHGFDEDPEASGLLVAGVAGVVAIVYGAATATLAGSMQIGDIGESLTGGVTIGLITGWLAAARSFGWHFGWPRQVPEWVRALPRACGAGLGILVAGGTLVICLALLLDRSQVQDLQNSLSPGLLGTSLLAAMQAFWAPNLVIWGISWLVGAGFSLGVGTVVSPFVVQLGVLPSVPMFGAVPAAGMPSQTMLVWSAVPVVAGVAAGWVAARSQVSTDMRLETGAGIGGGAGVLTGLAATVVAAISRGNLGTVELTGLGPLIGTMVLLAPVLLGLGGLAAGLVVALGRPKVAPRVLPVDTLDKPAPKPPPQPWKDALHEYPSRFDQLLRQN